MRPVSYGSVGMTAASDAISFPPPGFHVIVEQQRVGSGAERFAAARDALFTWGMQRTAGVAIEILEVGDNDGYQGLRQNDDGQWRLAGNRKDFHFASDGQPYLTPGTDVAVSGAWLRATGASNYRVIYNVHENKRCGFSWGTLDETPVSGEEYFGLDWRDDDTVWATVISITSIPGSRWSFVRDPFVRWQQRRLIGRYVRSLSPVYQSE